MPVYEVEQYELHSQTYRIEAASEADAITKVRGGDGEIVEGKFCYIEVSNMHGMPVDNLSLSDANELGDHNYVSGIRSVKEIGD